MISKHEVRLLVPLVTFMVISLLALPWLVEGTMQYIDLVSQGG